MIRVRRADLTGAQEEPTAIPVRDVAELTRQEEGELAPVIVTE
jgi:hypothetical protein